MVLDYIIGRVRYFGCWIANTFAEIGNVKEQAKHERILISLYWVCIISKLSVRYCGWLMYLDHSPNNIFVLLYITWHDVSVTAGLHC